MKKLFTIYNFLFVLVLGIGIFFRFYALGEIPGSLNWDEVSWGYNAYSIAQTGKDEYGESFPLSFKAFGDYKQPMYVYLDAVSVSFFGLTPFAVRLPSAIFGTLSILSVFLLTRMLFNTFSRVRTLSLVVMFLFAISPWSIQFSRVAYEANVSSFFVITGVALSLYGFLKKRMWLASLGVCIMALSGYTYHSAKLFTPLLLIGLLSYARYTYKISYKKLLILLFIFILASSVWILDSRTTARGRSVLFTSNQTEILKDSIEKNNADMQNNDRLASTTHNRRFVYTEVFLKNYLSHYEPNFLFIGNDSPRHHPPGMGVMYLVLLPVILVGIIFLIKNKIGGALFVFFWFLIAPLAGSLATEAPNASRSLAFLPTWDIFAGFGIMSMTLLKDKSRKLIFLSVFVIALFINIIYYMHHYFDHTDFETGYDWQEGYKEVAVFAEGKKDSGRNVFFDRNFEQPYIFYLFYAQYPPRDYYAKNNDMKECFAIGHVWFGKCEDKIKSGDYFVSLGPDSAVEGTRKLEDVVMENGDVAAAIFEKIK